MEMKKAWLEVAQLSYIIQWKAEVSSRLVDPVLGMELTLRKEGVRNECWILTSGQQLREVAVLWT